MGIEGLLKKSYSVIKYEGVNNFVKKSLSYTKRKILRTKAAHHTIYKDVLFINGCMLPHPERYRVHHQIEQLHFNGYSCDTVYFEDLDLDSVRFYRTFIFFRCPHTDTIEKFITRARYFNKTIIFDIDDLVIDQKYVENVKHLKTMNDQELNLYMDGVKRMKRTLLLCDYAITTTGRLANELKPFVKEVFINRNVASDRMLELSVAALKAKKELISDDRIVLGYFSGSITHNEDFELILPAIKNIMQKYNHVYLKVVGFLDFPDELKDFADRIIFEKFMDWTKLPALIASVDINLAPLVSSVFNEAKSENKWMEAALVKVPTVSSNVGAFVEAVVNSETGVLCDGLHEWEGQLSHLIEDKDYRLKIGANAYEAVMQKYLTSKTGYGLLEFLESIVKPNIAFVLPSTEISGGVNVVIKHCNILRDSGVDVTIISMSDDDNNVVNKDGETNVISYHRHHFHGFFNKCVATLWTTNSFLNTHPKIKEKYYLVQGYETDFYEPGNNSRIFANLTYASLNNLNYITISKWCEKWLREDFRKDVIYARNGIDLSIFKSYPRDFNGKIRILVEGNSTDYYKNVDESFKITNQLDKDKYEIWYLSYNGAPKEWYRVDKFLNKVPHDEVGQVYAQCHILIKSSLLESFSYPPLEMMATGGIAIVAPNVGNVEYLKHAENSLFYEQGNIDSALEMIHLACEDENLRDRLIVSGLETARNRDWENIIGDVLMLYGFRNSKIETHGENYEEKTLEMV